MPVLVVVEVMLPLVVVVVVDVILPLVEVEVDPDDEPELLPDVLPEVVVLISILPPLDELPPPKKPPKKPPPKPPPPQPPPTTTGWPPPAATTTGCCGSSGSGIGIIATCSLQQSSSFSITRRMRLTFLGSARLAGRSLTYLTGAAPLVLYSTWVVCGSATCTAPPVISAPPAATAASFARAIRTDMVYSLLLDGADRTDPGRPHFSSAARRKLPHRANGDSDDHNADF
ncbi:MAG TPA: hypothetical protein VL100_04410 [Croceibacterium sp.]|nr:hypothetical protein [Croceibacterium sp.]